MNDIIYEILDAATCLITGSNAYMFILNIILSVCSMFPGADCLTAFDLSGNSSKYSKFCPVYHDVYDMIDILADMQKQIDSGKNSQKWLIINNIEEIISNIYTASDKKQFLQLLSDVLHRGSSSGLHVIVIANKYTLPIISGIDCRVYAGKCDKKSAVKFFGGEAAALMHSDLPDFGQALAQIDSDIYKINVPDVSAEAAAFYTTIADDTSHTAAAKHIRIKSRIKAAKPTETDLHPIQATAQQSDAVPDDTDKNIIVLFLSFIIDLISGVFNRISAVRTRSFLVKIPVTVAMIVLYILSAPVKILYCLAQSGFPGGFMVLCIVYMTVTTLLQCIR